MVNKISLASLKNGSAVPPEKAPMVDCLYDRAVERGDIVFTQEHVFGGIEPCNVLAGRQNLSPRNIPNFFKDSA
jgi:hypothetical protein